MRHLSALKHHAQSGKKHLGQILQFWKHAQTILKSCANYFGETWSSSGEFLTLIKLVNAHWSGLHARILYKSTPTKKFLALYNIGWGNSADWSINFNLGKLIPDGKFYWLNQKQIKFAQGKWFKFHSHFSSSVLPDCSSIIGTKVHTIALHQLWWLSIKLGSL